MCSARRSHKPRAASQPGGARGDQVCREDRRAIEACHQVREARRRQGFALTLYLAFFLIFTLQLNRKPLWLMQYLYCYSVTQPGFSFIKRTSCR